jgi:hypothetical protein
MNLPAAQTAVSATPGHLTFTDDNVWVIDEANGTLTELLPQ